VSATTVKLLRAASEIVGGDKALADHLCIGEALLARYMADERVLPDPLLLRAVDVILEDRKSQLAVPSVPAGELPARTYD
jgi:hypothetical protein